MLLFLSEKKEEKKEKKLLDIQEYCIRKLGKIQIELKLLSGVYY